VFGIMGAIAVYGFISSQKEMRERDRSTHHHVADSAGNGA
jgi:hypothetical protein